MLKGHIFAAIVVFMLSDRLLSVILNRVAAGRQKHGVHDAVGYEEVHHGPLIMGLGFKELPKLKAF
jgi:hypothetical protein